MNFWKYKAFNDQHTIIEDVAKCPTFPQLAFALRQKGLQIIEATSIQPFEYHAALRLKKMKMRIEQEFMQNIAETPQQQSSPSNNRPIHRLIKRIASLFRWW